MADYSQPPFGMPFPIPPPHPQHVTSDPQANMQGGSSDPRQASIPANYQFNGSLPGLNLQSYAQNSQQPQYPYWPPPPAPQPSAYGAVPFPPHFLNQSGLPIPPPPPPGSAFFPPVPQLPFQNASVPSPASLQPSPAAQQAPQPMAVSNDRLAGLDSDREDGEVSEGDGRSKSPAGHVKPIAEPPRSVPPVAKEISRNDGQNGSHSLGSGASNYHVAQTMHQLPSTSALRPTGPRMLDDLKQKREEAKKFVKVLHANNIRYPSLAAEGLDEQLLRELYRDMNLPSQPEPIPAPIHSDSPNALTKTGQSTSAKSAALPLKTDGQNAQPKPTTALKTNVTTTPAVKSAPSPSDRQSYIARLQAAKMAKQSGTAKVTPPQHAPPAVEQPSTTAKPSQISPTNTVANGPNGKPALSEEERARQTEMIKKRLEILKAAELAKAKQKLPDSSPGTPQASADVGTLPLPPSHKIDRSSQLSPNMAQASENIDSAHSVQTPLAASFSKLPGLFMNSTSSLPAVNPPVATPNGTTIPRKRPVASDFDEITTPRSSGPTYTRPLGQSPHEHTTESMIIEVSDEDSAGSEMDLDDDQAIPRSSSAHTPPSRGHASNHAAHQLPGLTDFPSRSESVRPISSAVNTPPPVRTPASLQTQAEINRIEREALNLKLKIAEMSRNRKATVAKKDAIASSPAPQKFGIAPEPKHPGSSPKSSSILLPPVFPENSSIQQCLPMDSHSEAGAHTGKSREWKKQRRAELESSLQSLDAEMENEKARLAQLEKEMAEIAANKQKRQQNREMLVQELESLGIDTEGMPDEELLAHKEEIDQLKEAQPDIESFVSMPRTVTPPNGVAEVGDIHSISGALNLLSDVAGTENIPMEPNAIASPAQVSFVQPVAPVEPAGTEVVPPEDVAQPLSPTNVVAQEGDLDRPSILPVPAVVPTEAVVGPVNVPDYATPVDDSEDFYSPEPAIAPPIEQQPESDEPPQSNAKSLSEEGEVEMSESSSSVEDDEEEYEPEEPGVVELPPVSAPETQPLDIANSPASSMSSSSMSSSDDEGELYEPPEPDQVVYDVGDSVADTNAPSGQLADDEQGAMDISMSSNESSSDQRSPSAPADLSISQNNAPNPLINIADDLVPELQSQEQASVTELPPEDPAIDPTQFVPYESPLRIFKSYRYHPLFPQEVAGGFASQTYSHQIDPDKPLCRFEAVGGTCNDPHCDSQHFRDMNITGEKLLVQLGTANPGKTQEEKQQWNDGLRLVLKELRQNNIKDPNGIALEIAKYRRQFFNDDTRVVNL